MRFATRTLRDDQDMPIRREFFHRRRVMVEREIFSRRLAALRGYLDKLAAFGETSGQEFQASPAS